MYGEENDAVTILILPTLYPMWLSPKSVSSLPPYRKSLSQVCAHGSFFLLRFYPVCLLWGEMISFAFLNNTFYTLAYFKTLNKWTRSLFLKRLTGLLCVVVILSFPLLWNIPPCAHTLGWKKFNLLFTGRLLLLPVIKNSAAIHQKHLLVMKGKKWGGENGHNLNKVIKINITEKGQTSCPSYTTSEKDAILLLWYSSHKTLIGI